MACTENSEDEDELLAIGEAMKPMSLSVGLRERSRAEKVEWAQMIQGAKQATIVCLAPCWDFFTCWLHERVSGGRFLSPHWCFGGLGSQTVGKAPTTGGCVPQLCL